MNPNPSDRPLIGAEAIARRVAELAAEIRGRHGGETIVLICVLKGALHFASDLLRAVGPPARIEFVRAKSYQGAASTGSVRIGADDAIQLGGARAVVVEDVLDTGATSAALLDALRAQGPAALELCVLLDKPGRRTADIEADYRGFVIGEEFVVGYGLDYDEAFRELPAIYVLDSSAGQSTGA